MVERGDADGGYDLMLVQTVPVHEAVLDHAHRLLRVGGMLLTRGVLRPGEHADAEARFLKTVVDDERFDAAILPLDDGVVLATRRPDLAAD